MFLNLSNHASSQWSEEQLKGAHAFHPQIVDMPFPHVSPTADTAEVEKISISIIQEIKKLKPVAVHLMGEFTLTFQLAWCLKSEGIPVMASTTQRNVTNNPDGTKTTRFTFVRFREY